MKTTIFLFSLILFTNAFSKEEEVLKSDLAHKRLTLKEGLRFSEEELWLYRDEMLEVVQNALKQGKLTKEGARESTIWIDREINRLVVEEGNRRLTEERILKSKQREEYLISRIKEVKKATAEQDKIIAEQDKQLAAIRKKGKEQDKQLAERDNQLAEVRKKGKEQDKKIKEIKAEIEKYKKWSKK